MTGMREPVAVDSASVGPTESAGRGGSLLGRLTHHLRTQNWTAVVIGLVVVVFGVFLGFQLTAWSTDVSNQKREAGILRNIASDLKEDRQQIGTASAATLRRMSAAH